MFIVSTFALVAVLSVHQRRLRGEIVRRQLAQKQAEEAAQFDGLTGVANRRMLQQEFEAAISRARQTQTRLGLLVIDLDGFHGINETLGHSAGDVALRIAAMRLRAALRNEYFIARLGSDDFAVLVPMEGDETNELFRIAARALAALREPMTCEGHRVRLTASIGISNFPRDGDTGAALLPRAEAAMLQAKGAGKDRYAIYDPVLEANRRQRIELQARLCSAFEQGEIIAFYQPFVDLSSLQPVGYEALARWNHPLRGLLGPLEFIPMVEDSGLEQRLFTAMLQRVCEDMRNWPEDLTVAINLSPVQLRDPYLTRSTLDLISAARIPPHRVELEITETALVEDFDRARGTLLALKEAGVRISLDDFGTGFSSLRHLNELPIDKIKIDRSFTQHIPVDLQSRKIVASILGLGHSLGLVTVAEGVETQEQLDWLRANGCELGQGFLFARPMAPEEVPIPAPRAPAATIGP